MFLLWQEKLLWCSQRGNVAPLFHFRRSNQKYIDPHCLASSVVELVISSNPLINCCYQFSLGGESAVSISNVSHHNRREPALIVCRTNTPQLDKPCRRVVLSADVARLIWVRRGSQKETDSNIWSLHRNKAGIRAEMKGKVMRCECGCGRSKAYRHKWNHQAANTRIWDELQWPVSGTLLTQPTRTS